MKKLFLFSALLGIAINISAQNRSINFETSSFSQAREKSEKENVMIFIDFYTTWCGPCKWMAKNVFTNDTIADFYNRNFVCISIDAEKGEGINLAKKFKINSYPSFLFVGVNDKVFHQSCGSMPVNSFLSVGQAVLDRDKRTSTLIERYEVGDRTPKFVLKFIEASSMACMPTKDIVATYLASLKENDLYLKDNWNIINSYVSDFNSREFQFLMKNGEKFSTLYGDTVVNRKILLTSLSYYEKKADWQKYAEVACSDQVKKYFINEGGMLNNAAWNIFENINNQAILKKALILVQRSIELDSRPENIDTYANLLFKLGRKDEAIETEKKALSLVGENKGMEEGLKQTLAKFEKK